MTVRICGTAGKGRGERRTERRLPHRLTRFHPAAARHAGRADTDGTIIIKILPAFKIKRNIVGFVVDIGKRHLQCAEIVIRSGDARHIAVKFSAACRRYDEIENAAVFVAVGKVDHPAVIHGCRSGRTVRFDAHGSQFARIVFLSVPPNFFHITRQRRVLLYGNRRAAQKIVRRKGGSPFCAERQQTRRADRDDEQQSRNNCYKIFSFRHPLIPPKLTSPNNWSLKIKNRMRIGSMTTVQAQSTYGTPPKLIELMLLFWNVYSAYAAVG